MPGLLAPPPFDHPKTRSSSSPQLAFPFHTLHLSPLHHLYSLLLFAAPLLCQQVNYTQYDIVVGYYGLDQMDYLRVQAWSLIWA